MKHVLQLVCCCLILLMINNMTIQAQRTCGTDEHLQERLLNDTEFAKKFDKWTSMEKISDAERQRINCNGNPTIIPIAVHYAGVVDCSNPTCLLQAAQAQIAVLNEDFGASNADLSLYDDLTAACSSSYPASTKPNPGNGTCIQFCLATTNHPAGEGLADGEPAITVGKYTWLTQSDPWAGYLNLYVSDGTTAGQGANGLGISALPGAADGDGFWTGHNYFGGPGFTCTSGAALNTGAPFNLGRTATHEAGHYFAVFHVFQGGCDDQDATDTPGPIQINDTPPQSNDTGGCPNVTSCANVPNGGCGNPSSFYSFMDYSNDACLVMFTEDQSRVINYWGNNANRTQFVGIQAFATDKCTAPLTATMATVCGDPAPTVCASYDGNTQTAPYTNFTTPECDGNNITAGFEVWANEAYSLEATAGANYTFSFCDNYSANAAGWNGCGILTIAYDTDDDGVITDESDILFSNENTGGGCTATFTTPTAGNVIMVINDCNCTGTVIQVDNGIPSLTTNSGIPCSACPTFDPPQSSSTEVCSGIPNNFIVVANVTNCNVLEYNLTWTVNGTATGPTTSESCAKDISRNFSLNHSGTTCAPETVTVAYTATCEGSGSSVSSGSFDVMVYPDPSTMTSYWSIDDGGCDGPVVNIDSGCETYIAIAQNGAPVFPVAAGSNGTVNYDVTYNLGPCCQDNGAANISDVASGEANDANGTCVSGQAGSSDDFPFTFSTPLMTPTVAATGLGSFSEFCFNVTSSTNTQDLVISLNNTSTDNGATLWIGPTFGGNDGDPNESTVNLCMDIASLSTFFEGEPTGTWEITIIDANCAFDEPTDAVLNCATIGFFDQLFPNACSTTTTANYDCVGATCPTAYTGDDTGSEDQCADALTAPVDIASDDDILADLDDMTNAVVVWSNDPMTPPDAPMGCDPATTTYVASIGCPDAATIVLADVYTYTVTAYPDQSNYSVSGDASTCGVAPTVISDGTCPVEVTVTEVTAPIAGCTTDMDADNDPVEGAYDYSTELPAGTTNPCFMPITGNTVVDGCEDESLCEPDCPTAYNGAESGSEDQCADALTAPVDIPSDADILADLDNAGDAVVVWSLDPTTVANAPADCASATTTYVASIGCPDANTIVLADVYTYTVTAYPTDISAFLTVNDGGCTTSITVDASCGDNVTISDDGTQSATPGDNTGTHTYTVSWNGGGSCTITPTMLTANYDCPPGDQCPANPTITTSTLEACHGDAVTITGTFDTDGINLTGEFDITEDSGTITGITIDTPFDVVNTTCAPITYTFTAVATCSDESDIPVGSGSLTAAVTVYPTDISAFLTANDGDCTTSITVDESCGSNVTISDDGTQSATPGDGTGTHTYTVTWNGGGSCSIAPTDITANYDCPLEDQCPANPTITASVAEACHGDAITITALFGTDGINLTGEFSITEDSETITGITAGTPFDAINTTCAPITYTFTAIATCSNEDDIPAGNGSLTTTVTVYPTDISAFLTANDGSCTTSITVDPSCDDNVAISNGGTQTEDPGAGTGTHTYEVTWTGNGNCAVLPATITANYDCQLGDQCPANPTITASTTEACDGDPISIIGAFGVNGTNLTGIFDITESTNTIGGIIDGTTFTVTNTTCAPITYTFNATATCSNGDPIPGAASVTVTVYPSDISAFVSANNGDCSTTVIVDPACDSNLSVTPSISQSAMPGEVGTHTYTIDWTGGSSCVSSVTLTANYDCPTTAIPCPTSSTLDITGSEDQCAAGTSIPDFPNEATILASLDNSGNLDLTINWSTLPTTLPTHSGGCRVETIDYALTVSCPGEVTLDLGTYTVFVYPSDISAFVSILDEFDGTEASGEDCSTTVLIDASCGNSVIVTPNIRQEANPGDGNGQHTYVFSWDGDTPCTVPDVTLTANYFCDQGSCEIPTIMITDVDGLIGGVTPNHYNVTTFEIQGAGNYDLDWDKEGYVRYKIVELENGNIMVTVIYSDNAIWNVNVIDGNFCETSISSTVSQAQPVVISSHNIISSGGPEVSEGAIDITVIGGTAPYTYAWGGPQQYSSTDEDISGLHFGWYRVDVCDVNGDCTYGWFWVAPIPSAGNNGGSIRGKTTVALTTTIKAYPNPTTTTTTIEFSVPTEMTASINVFDLAGKKVKELFNGVAANTIQMVTLDATELANGIYFVQLTTATGEVKYEKVVIAK